MNPPKITDNLSFVPLKLQMSFRETKLAIGTGFFYKLDERTHLVTTWHNVTGRHPETNQPLHSEGGIPDRMTIGVPYDFEKDGLQGIEWKWRKVSLYTDDQMQCPAWYEHPTHRSRVDVVTMPISGTEETALFIANDQRLKLDLIKLAPSLDVFILGFPKGMSGGGHFPIWKRGSIATEPDIDLDGLPKLLIDTATREGMSGAPVFAQRSSYWIPEDKEKPDDSVFGIGRRFLGVYSGRVGDNSFQAQLGIVWKPSAIEEVIRHCIEAGEEN
jgi:hypothetical protein